MRRLHRWFGLVTGLFMAAVAITGIGVQLIDMLSPDEHHHGPPACGAPLPPPPAVHGIEWRRLLDHIHDGEVAGLGGRMVSLLLGISLLLFSISGIWMYWQMFSARRRNGRGELMW